MIIDASEHHSPLRRVGDAALALIERNPLETVYKVIQNRARGRAVRIDGPAGLPPNHDRFALRFGHDRDLKIAGVGDQKSTRLESLGLR